MACLLDLGWWGDTSTDIRLRLRKAFNDFTAWRKRHKLGSSQRPFTVRSLFKVAHGAYLTAKGFNSRIMAAWLAEEAEAAYSSVAIVTEEVTLTAHAMPLACILCGVAAR